MGVCGCGKSSVAAALAELLSYSFLEADNFHPPSNVCKMRSGTPLTDEDRAPWLAAIATALRAARGAGRPCVLACSALKARYREALRQGDPGLRVVHLHPPREAVAARLAARMGHFMPPSLLDSQLAILEPPGGGEGAALTLDDAGGTPQALARAVAAWL